MEMAFSYGKKRLFGGSLSKNFMVMMEVFILIRILLPVGVFGATFSRLPRILKGLTLLSRSFNLKVSNGSNILVWKDPWCNGGTRLMDKFPRPCALESSQDCMVSDRWCFENGNWVGRWSWRYPPCGRAINDLSSLLNMIGNLSLSPDGVDKWSWAYEASSLFKVKTFSNSIQNLQLVDCSLGKHHSWNSWIPRKVNINIWRASLDRLPTRLKLVSCGIPISDDSCPFCEAVAEDIDHCLINCPKVIRVWRKLWSWWNLGSCTIFLSFSIQNIAMENVCNIGCFV
ncbi:RNA-directed DNA polymerase, eukaryota, reverse transcriptase zinc-binding domain protein [Tanacetum coccineum]